MKHFKVYEASSVCLCNLSSDYVFNTFDAVKRAQFSTISLEARANARLAKLHVELKIIVICSSHGPRQNARKTLKNQRASNVKNEIYDLIVDLIRVAAFAVLHMRGCAL
jgi:rhodanese-related sulfurtransferase